VDFLAFCKFQKLLILNDLSCGKSVRLPPLLAVQLYTESMIYNLLWAANEATILAQILDASDFPLSSCFFTYI